MAILEEEVWIGLAGGNVNHFESLGYEIPRVKNKYGKITTPIGTKILVKIDDLPKNSRIEVTKICDICGKSVLNQRFDAISTLRAKGDGKDRCNECGQLNGSNNRLNNINFKSSFEYHSKLKNKEYLLDEFSDKNEKRPNEISFGSDKEYFWNCSKCNNEYSMDVGSRISRNRNCPYCANQKILVGFNDLWTIHPNIAKFLANPKRGYEIITGATIKELFRCNECGYEQAKRVTDVIRYGFSCACLDKISFPEKFMMSVLNQLDVKYQTQKTFKWSKNKRYDFYLKEFNLIIETHGDQHYTGNFETIGGRTLKEEQENDLLKENLAKENSIKYIIVDCRFSETKYIKTNIKSSELQKIFRLEKIDWEMANKYALSSLIKKSCNLWNGGIKSTSEIGKILKLSSNTIVLYLKQGAKIGWCNYDPKESLRKSSMIQGKRNSRKIIQLTKKGDFIKEWDSISEAQRQLNISNLSIACSGKLYTAGGFRWLYKSDYEKLTSESNKDESEICI